MSDNEISKERREELLNDLLREEGEAHLDPDWVLPGTSGVNEEDSGEGEEDEEEQEEDGGRGERYLERKREGYRRMEREGKRVMSRGRRRTTKKNEECRKIKTSNLYSLNPEAIKSRVKYNRRMMARAKTEEEKEVFRKRLIIDLAKTKPTKEEEEEKKRQRTTTRTPTDPRDKEFLATISRCQSGKVVYREIEDALDSLVLKQQQRVSVAKKKIREFLVKRDQVMGEKDWQETVLESSRSGKKNPSQHGKACPLYGCGLAHRDVPRHLSSVHNIDKEDAVELNHLLTSASSYFDAKIDKDLLTEIPILPRSTLKVELAKRGVVVAQEEEQDDQPVVEAAQQAGVRDSMYSEESETLRWMVKCPAKH